LGDLGQDLTILLTRQDDCAKRPDRFIEGCIAVHRVGFISTTSTRAAVGSCDVGLVHHDRGPQTLSA
jgi:hypothetical protein